MKHFWNSFISVFKHNERIYWPLVALFSAINMIVLMNAIFHNPIIGYDADGHVAYVDTLAQGHFPDRATNHEFFSPPLTYFVPALFKVAGLALVDAVRTGLFVNFLASLGITYLLLIIIRRLASDRPEIQTLALLILGMLPVYYKTLSFLRGEPLVTFFTLLIIVLSIKIFIDKDFSKTNMASLGFALGMSILSRQWAFFIFPAVILLGFFLAIRNKEIRKAAIISLTVSVMIAFILGAWFYIGLIFNYGTVTAFNRGPIGTKYLSPTFFTKIDGKVLFTDPVRPALPDQFWPIMHSEIWGDYWSYFTIYAYRPQTGYYLIGREIEDLNPNASLQNLVTNKFSFNQYLAKVNIISLFPSLLLLVGVLFGFIQMIRFMLGSGETNRTIEGFLGMIIFFTLVGYTWFMVQYPAPGKGDTTKASYILNLFPLLALLIASLLQRVMKNWKWGIWGMIYLLSLIMLYDSRAMVTHYILYPW